jgi:hypothetical protein
MFHEYVSLCKATHTQPLVPPAHNNWLPLFLQHPLQHWAFAVHGVPFGKQVAA